MTAVPQLIDSPANSMQWMRSAARLLNQVIRFTMQKGASADRPGNPTDGQQFYDRTLKKPIWWNTEDAEWKDATGTGV